MADLNAYKYAYESQQIVQIEETFEGGHYSWPHPRAVLPFEKDRRGCPGRKLNSHTTTSYISAPAIRVELSAEYLAADIDAEPIETSTSKGKTASLCFYRISRLLSMTSMEIRV